MTHDTLKATLTAFLNEIWNKGDFSNLDELVSDRYDIENDPGDAWDKQTLDRETFQKRVMYSRNAFPDLNFVVKDMIAEDDKVVASWVMSGTHRGDLANLSATGKPFGISGMTIYYFADGKICGHTQAYDRLGFVHQMGIMG